MLACACGQSERGTWAMRPIARDYVFPARDKTGEVIAEGKTVSRHDLDDGRMAYVNFCASCHGLDGDGKGYAAPGLDPPPRDFRTAAFKFAAVRSGELPSDDDLLRLIQSGMNGTAMPPWRIDEADMLRIVQFIKTFPPPGCGHDDPECAPDGPRASRWVRRRTSGKKAGQLHATIGEAVRVSDDPWKGRDSEALAKGEELYHLTAQCSSCHPAYLTAAELDALSQRVAGKASGGMRDKPYEGTTLLAANNPYADDIRPPDFTVDTLRSVRKGQELADVHRLIAAGVGGIMPAWIDALTQEQLWALTHYVSHLTALARPEKAADRAALKKKLGL
jgi:mono/diheme cytochrome c family protein